MNPDLLLFFIVGIFVMLIIKNMINKEMLNDEKVLYIFYLDTCPASKRLLKILEEIEKNEDLAKYSNLKILKINYNKNRDLAKLYNIHFVPTVLFDDGNYRYQLTTDERNYVDFTNFIMKHLNN